MEIGVRIPAAGVQASPENIVTVARWAEQLGYHAVWVSDHVVLPQQVASSYPYDSKNRWRAPSETPWIDPLLALAWAAAVAPSVKLGTSVLVVPLRNPVLLAKQLASLDVLSGGRVILGAGVGWMKEEFDLVGVPFERRGARSAEMVQLMRAFWADEPVGFKGEFYQVANCMMRPLPVQQPIPVVWGGHSDYALKRVAKFGDGWHPTLITMAELSEGMTRLRQHCNTFGRDPSTLTVIVRPGNKYPVNADTQAQHQELGVHQVVIDPPLDDLSRCKAEMERVAELCGLRPRS